MDLSPYELLGISFSFELDILEIFQLFKAQKVSPLAAERAEDFPLVFSGGPVPMTNPEPYAPFFDFFLIGEGEELLNEVIECYHRSRHLKTKAERLFALAKEVKGVYVPSLYEPEYESAEGPLLAIRPKQEAVSYTHLTLPTIYSV